MRSLLPLLLVASLAPAATAHAAGGSPRPIVRMTIRVKAKARPTTRRISKRSRTKRIRGRRLGSGLSLARLGSGLEGGRAVRVSKTRITVRRPTWPAARKTTVRRRVVLSWRKPISLGRAQLGIVGRIGQRLPGFAPSLEAVGRSRYRVVTKGRSLAQHGPDLYIAPYALQKFERQVFMLNTLGVRHNAISPANIVVTSTGELRLVGGWNKSALGGSLQPDLAGLQSVRQFLRDKVGMGG